MPQAYHSASSNRYLSASITVQEISHASDSTPLYYHFPSNCHVLSSVGPQRCLVTLAPEVHKNGHNDICIITSVGLCGITKCLDIIHTPFPSQELAGVCMLSPALGTMDLGRKGQELKEEQAIALPESW